MLKDDKRTKRTINLYAIYLPHVIRLGSFVSMLLNSLKFN